MKIHIASHPLITHKLTLLRDENTPSPTFRSLTEEIVSLLAYEAMRDIKTQAVSVKTPVAIAKGAQLTKPSPVVVPILRAGLGMLEGMSRLIPTAEIGFLGMVRDEKTLKASTYANRLPDDLTNRQCFILDPMLATGGTLVAAIEFLAHQLLNQYLGLKPAVWHPRCHLHARQYIQNQLTFKSHPFAHFVLKWLHKLILSPFMAKW